MSSLLDRNFRYRRACETDVMETLKRNGFKPTTKAQREAQQKRRSEPVIKDSLTPRAPSKKQTRAEQWPMPQLRAVGGKSK